MKVLLIAAPLMEEGYSSGKERILPLGISYLASYLRARGHSIKMGSGDTSRLESDLNSFMPDLVGISSMTPSFPAAVSIANTIKNLRDIPIVLGGQHATAMPEEILKNYRCFDYLICGEGEVTFSEFLEVFQENRGNMKSVKGLAWRQAETGIIMNVSRELICDIDTIPFPAWDLLDKNTLNASYRYMGFKRAIPMISSRGCPFNCSFCSSHLTMGRKYRMHSVGYMLEKIKKIKSDFGIDNIIFWDDVFTLIPERLKDFCDGVLKNRLNIHWYCLSRTESVSPETVRLMKRAGCEIVSIGVESGNRDILKAVHKQLDPGKVEIAVKLFKANGIRVQTTFIIGFPFDNHETVRETIEFAKKLSPTFALFFRFIPYPNTDIVAHISKELMPKEVKEWENFVASGTYKSKSFSPNFSDEEIAVLLKKGYAEFYFRPKQLLNIIKSINSFSCLKGYAESFFSLNKIIRV